MKVFNVNNQVLVKLNDSGLKLYKNYLKKTCSKFGTKEQKKQYMDTCLAEIDENNNIKLQLWEMMNIFGGHLCGGVNPPFDTDLLIEDKDLKSTKKR